MTSNLLALALIMLSAAGARVPATASRLQPPEDPSYRIGPEDVVQVSVWNNEAMSRTAPIRPDGKLSLPLLNDVQAAGLTPMELRDRLMQRLAEYIPHPEVSVVVTEVRSFKVAIIGQVPKPDRFELRSAATVMDVLAMAGGFTEFASRSRIVVIRSTGDSIERIPFDYEKIRNGDPSQPNFRLHPGDIILVP
jgi:polysaccharide export outer membrane protein